MDLIIDGTNALADPGQPLIFGSPGFFTEGTPGIVSATNVRAWWLNMMQGELRNLLLAAGVVPDHTNSGQVAQSVMRLAGANVSYVTAGTTLTPDQAGLVACTGAASGYVMILPLAAAMGGKRIQFDFSRLDTVSANVVAIQLQGADIFYPGNDQIIGLPTLGRITVVGDGSGKWYVMSQSPEGGSKIFFYGSTTLTVPNNVTRLSVRGVGGGGGGAGCDGSLAGGGGGSGGGFDGLCEVAPGQQIPIVCGAAGIGGGGANSGTAGGTTSFGTYASASGGGAGIWSSVAPIGGAPGTGNTSNPSFVGGLLYGGFGGDASPGTNGKGGSGAASMFGGGVKASRYFATQTQSAAPGAGGGGGEGPASVAGTNGLPGLVIVTFGGF